MQKEEQGGTSPDRIEWFTAPTAEKKTPPVARSEYFDAAARTSSARASSRQMLTPPMTPPGGGKKGAMWDVVRFVTGSYHDTYRAGT